MFSRRYNNFKNSLRCPAPANSRQSTPSYRNLAECSASDRYKVLYIRMPRVDQSLPSRSDFVVHFFDVHSNSDQLRLRRCNFRLPCACSIEPSVKEGLLHAVRVQKSPFRKVVRSAARSANGARLSSYGINKVRSVKQRNSLRLELLRPGDPRPDPLWTHLGQ